MYLNHPSANGIFVQSSCVKLWCVVAFNSSLNGKWVQFGRYSPECHSIYFSSGAGVYSGDIINAEINVEIIMGRNMVSYFVSIVVEKGKPHIIHSRLNDATIGNLTIQTICLTSMRAIQTKEHWLKISFNNFHSWFYSSKRDGVHWILRICSDWFTSKNSSDAMYKVSNMRQPDT